MKTVRKEAVLSKKNAPGKRTEHFSCLNVREKCIYIKQSTNRVILIYERIVVVSFAALSRALIFLKPRNHSGKITKNQLRIPRYL